MAGEDLAEQPTIDFEAVLAASPNPYMIIDRERRFLWANKAYERATMRSLVDFRGRTLFEAFPAPDAESERVLDASIERAFVSGQPDELAFIAYAIRTPNGEMDTSYWSATHTPFRGPDGDFAYVLQHTVNITEVENLRRSRDETGVVERARSVERRSRDLAREVDQLRSLLEQTPGFMAVITGSEHRFQMTNAAYRRLLGERPLTGRTVAEAIPEVVEQGFVDILDTVFSTGEPYFGKREKVVFHDQGIREARETFLEFIFQPIRAPGGKVWGIFIQGHDVTEEVEAEERQRLLINELNHRVKNTLAVVQGLAQQSFGKSDDGRFEIFTARLAALAGAHNLLTEATWEAADLRELLYNSLEATAGLDIARVDFDGKPVTLPPPLALSLAMIAHELSTNAIKYGALSNTEGRIAVTWSTESRESGDSLLVVDWVEHGGPLVTPPEREGFGTRLIRRGLSGQGTCQLYYRSSGLYCRIEASL